MENDFRVLLGLVLEVRAAQKEYFENRDRAVLRESKRLETKLDALAKSLSEKYPEARQEEIPF